MTTLIEDKITDTILNLSNEEYHRGERFKKLGNYLNNKNARLVEQAIKELFKD